MCDYHLLLTLSSLNARHSQASGFMSWRKNSLRSALFSEYSKKNYFKRGLLPVRFMSKKLLRLKLYLTLFFLSLVGCSDTKPIQQNGCEDLKPLGTSEIILPNNENKHLDAYLEQSLQECCLSKHIGQFYTLLSTKQTRPGTFKLHTVTKRINDDQYESSCLGLIFDPKVGVILPKYSQRIASGSHKNVDSVITLQKNTTDGFHPFLQVSTLAMITPMDHPDAIEHFNKDRFIQEGLNERLKNFYIAHKIQKRDQANFSLGFFIDFDFNSCGQKAGAIFQPLLGKDLSWHDTFIRYDDSELYLRWMRDLAYSLSVLHTIGMVHNDIVPQNVIISQDEYSAYVGDFGTAFFLPLHYLKPSPSIILPQVDKTDFFDPNQFFTKPFDAGIFDHDKTFFGFLLLKASKKLRNTPTAQKCKWENFTESKDCLKNNLSELSTEIKTIAQEVCATNPKCLENIIAETLDPKALRRLSLKDIYVYLSDLTHPDVNSHPNEPTSFSGKRTHSF
jgi:hypothetical protein